MNCQKFENTIEAYIDGFLDDDLRRAMDEHRAVCPECAILAKAHSLVMRSLNCPEPVEAPKGLTERILARIEAESASAASVKVPDIQLIPVIDCRTFEEHVAAYADGLLDKTLRKALDEHRAACTSCDRQARIHDFVLATLNNTEPVAAPQGLENRIFAAVEVYNSETAAAAHPYPRFGMIAASIAAFGSLAASVIFIGKLLWKNSTEISTGIEQIGTLGTIVQATKTSFVMAVYMARGYLQGWLATVQPRIPEQLLYVLKLVIEPVQIPYLSFSLPVYLLIVMAALPLILRPYLSDSSYSAAAQRS